MKFRVLIDSLLTGLERNKHFTDAIYYEPEDLAEDNYARIFLQIEILDNPKSSRLVTQIILDSLKQNLYKNLRQDSYKAFEDVLKVLNQELNNLKHEAKDWIGKLNATIGVLSGDTLHITTTGHSEVILVRHERVNVLSDDLAPLDNIYDNTFVNIVSGTLKENDLIVISSKSILDVVPEMKLTQAVSNKQLANAVLSLEKLINQTYHSSLVVSIQTPFQDLQDDNKEDFEFSTEENEVPVSSGNKNKINYAQNIELAKKYLGHGKKFIFKLKEIFIPPDNSEILSQDISDDDLDATFEQKIKSSIEQNIANNEIDGLKKLETLEDIKKASLEESYYGSSAISKGLDKDSKFKNTFNLLKRNFVQNLKGINPHKKANALRKSNVIGILIVSAIVIFAIYSVYTKNVENKAIEALRGKLLEIDSLIEKAKGRNIIDEKAKAREVLAEIDTALGSLKTTEYLQNEISEKAKSVDELRDSINEVVRVDVPKIYSDLEAKYTGVQALDLIFLKDTLYAISKDALLKLVLDQVVLIPLDKLNPGEEIQLGTAFESEGSILLFTSSNRMFEFKKDEFTEITLKDNLAWKNKVSIGNFGRRIYLLDPVENQIWRYARQGQTFLNPDPYKPFDVDLKDALDFAIVGDIYILKQNGVISRTNSQKNEEYKLSEIPKETDLGKTAKIEMNSTLKQVFLTDPTNNRIVVTGAKGTYVKQYVFPNLGGKLKDIYINENAKKMYVLTQNKVFEVELEQ